MFKMLLLKERTRPVQVAIFMLIVTIVSVAARDALPNKETNTRLQPRSTKYDLEKQFDHENEIDDRIHVTEPYKSLIQTTARIALAQTSISKHVNIDTAMDLLNKAGYLLSKTSTLIKAIKTIAITIATLLATTFVFPSSYRHLESLWNDPINTLNLDKYLANGLSERSVLALLSSRTDEALSRVGLNDNTCRERSICYAGEILRCSFRDSAETMIRFTNEHFSGTNYWMGNKYLNSFISGFVDRNCSAIDVNPSAKPSCFSNILNKVLSVPSNPSSPSR